MRILILSDSHGNIDNMVLAAERTQPDQLIHLGDLVRDGDELSRRFPSIPLAQVCGNCDCYDLNANAPSELLPEFEGHLFFLTHGHNYHVKSSLLSLEYAALEKGAKVCLFGHTHRPFLSTQNGLTLLNPGSIGSRYEPSFAVIEIENGVLRAALLTL